MNNKMVRKFEISKIYKGIKIRFIRNFNEPMQIIKNKTLICLDDNIHVFGFLPHGKFLIVEDNVIGYICRPEFDYAIVLKSEIYKI